MNDDTPKAPYGGGVATPTYQLIVDGLSRDDAGDLVASAVVVIANGGRINVCREDDGTFNVKVTGSPRALAAVAVGLRDRVEPF